MDLVVSKGYWDIYGRNGRMLLAGRSNVGVHVE